MEKKEYRVSKVETTSEDGRTKITHRLISKRDLIEPIFDCIKTKEYFDFEKAKKSRLYGNLKYWFPEKTDEEIYKVFNFIEAVLR